MARPKSNVPRKKIISLSIPDETRRELDFISYHKRKSISALLREWARIESRKLSEEIGVSASDFHKLDDEQ